MLHYLQPRRLRQKILLGFLLLGLLPKGDPPESTLMVMCGSSSYSAMNIAVYDHASTCGHMEHVTCTGDYDMGTSDVKEHACQELQSAWWWLCMHMFSHCWQQQRMLTKLHIVGLGQSPCRSSGNELTDRDKGTVVLDLVMDSGLLFSRAASLTCVPISLHMTARVQVQIRSDQITSLPATPG